MLTRFSTFNVGVYGETIPSQTSTKSAGATQAGGGKAMTKYEIILYWRSEDEAFIAEVPELPGCAADGATRQEALANVEVIIGEWLETARELERPIPAPKGRLLFA
jgi:predicted RNase H-like HicB family nuclease